MSTLHTEKNMFLGQLLIFVSDHSRVCNTLAMGTSGVIVVLHYFVCEDDFLIPSVCPQLDLCLIIQITIFT